MRVRISNMMVSYYFGRCDIMYGRSTEPDPRAHATHAVYWILGLAERISLSIYTDESQLSRFLINSNNGLYCLYSWR